MMHNLTQLFFVFPTKHNAHMPCETEKLTNVWQRRRQQGFILPPNIRLHSLTMPQLLQTFLLNSLSSHLQKLHSMTNSVHDAVCIALHCITDNTCNNYVTMPSMDFHKLTGLMYKPDKLQLRTSHYKGPQRRRFSKEIIYLGK